MNVGNENVFKKFDFNACALARGLLKPKEETEWPPFQVQKIIRPPSCWSVSQIDGKHLTGGLLLEGIGGPAHPMDCGVSAANHKMQ